MNQTPTTTEVSSDDRLWALLAYVLSPIVPIILMLMEDKKNRPFIRAHNGQALVLGVITVVLWILAGFTLCITGLLAIVLWILQVYWGIQAYGGKYVTIPVVTDFVKKQGWA